MTTAKDPDAPTTPASPAADRRPYPASTGSWVVVRVELTTDGIAKVDGRAIPTEGSDPRHALLQEMTRAAVTLGQDIGVTATDPCGVNHLIAHPAGTFTAVVGDPPWGPADQMTQPTPLVDLDLPGSRALTIDQAIDGGMDEGIDEGIDGGIDPGPETRGHARADAAQTAAGPPRVSGPPDQPPPWFATVPPVVTEPRPEVDATPQGPPPSDHGPGLAPTPATTAHLPPRPRMPPRASSTPAPDGTRQVRRRRATGVMVGIGLVGVLAAVAASQPAGRQDQMAVALTAPTASAAEVASTSGSPLPVFAHGLPGYRPQASWTSPIAGYTKIAVRDDRLAARQPAGRLVYLDAVTGDLLWTSKSLWGNDWDGPWLTRIDGQSAIVVASSTTLAYWPLASSGAPTSANPASTRGGLPLAPAEPILVSLPGGAQINLNGTTPLITTGGGQAWLVKGAALHQVPLPRQARPLAADDDVVIATQAGTWMRSSPTGYRVHPIPAPAAVTGPPSRVVDIAGRYLLVAWPKVANQTQAITFIDTNSPADQALLHTRLAAGVDITRAPVLRQNAGSVTAVGPVVVDTANQRINTLLPTYTPRALTSGHVYATTAAGSPTTSNVVDILLSAAADFTVVPVGAQAPLPFAATQGPNPVALVTVPTDDGWLIAGLPAAGS